MNMSRGMSQTILMLFLAAVFLPATTLARSESVNCFDYYKYGVAGVFDNLHTEKATYSPGDDAYISYDLVSKMDSPLVEGLVRIQIFYNDPENGEEMIDEFITQKDLSLKNGESIENEFTWKIPPGADSGEYVIKAYLISGDMFNLLGLSFLPYGPPGVPGEETKFRVANSGKSSSIHLDKSKTILNGAQYLFGEFSPQLQKDKQISLSTRLANRGAARKVDITYDIYSWDDVIGQPLRNYTKKETYAIGADSTKDLTYSAPPLPAGTYLLKITATSPDSKSITKMRFSIGGAKGRYVFAGLAKFPVINNEKNTIFFCFANSADMTTFFNAKGSVELLDEKGTTAFKENVNTFEVTPQPRGMKIDFIPVKDLSVATLKVTLSDESGKLMDDSAIKYDISKFQNIPSVFDLKLDKPSYNFEDTMQYTISYKGPSGTPLKGEVVGYLLDPTETIVYALKKTQINGELSDSIKLMGKSGLYKLFLHETTHNIKSAQAFTLAEKITPKTSAVIPDASQKNKESGSNMSSVQLIIYAIIIILLIGIVYYIIRNKSKKTSAGTDNKGGR